MHRLSRLTALLLALMMLLGSVSLAEGGLPIGGASGLTSDDWASLVDQAEAALFTPDEGATGKDITPEAPVQPEKPAYYPYTDIDELTLIQSSTPAEAAITASGAAILTCADEGQWQILVDGVWASLSGETGTTLTVNSAMMSGQSAEIRKALGTKNPETGEYEAYTQTAVISIVEAAPAMFSVSRDPEAEGDASDAYDIMTLEEANDDNMVVVQVVYCIAETRMPVADPYIGQIATGSALSTTLTLPRVTGYLAEKCAVEPLSLSEIAVFTQQTAEAAGTLAITVTSEQSVQDITIYVEYAPTHVDFVVKHFQQNVDDDYYTEVEADRVTMQGLTGAPVGDTLSNTYAGFRAIWYDPTNAIAADGSTVVEIYYNREYYLMTFDLDGGYGVESIYARYGAETNVDDPTRTGYGFDRWTYEDGTEIPDGLPKEMPLGGGRYKAVWTPADTTYTVVYWRADVQDGSGVTTYSYWGQKTVNAQSGTKLTPSVVGQKQTAAVAGLAEAGYFTYDEAATKSKNDSDEEIVVEGDGSTIVNVYYSRNVYEIRYHFARERGTIKQVSRSTGNGEVAKTAWTSTKNVDSIPQVTEGYEVKTEKYGNYTYYYIYVRAEYDAEITNWPADDIKNTTSGTTVVYWGSWAAEKDTGYRRKYGDAHANIVGAYPAMSADMIKDPSDSVAQRMTAWWGEGSDYISAHTYHVYFEAITDDASEGKQYVAGEPTYFTCAHNGNTRVDPFEYPGFVCINNDKDKQANSKNYVTNAACPFNDPDTAAHEGCAYCNVFYYDRAEYQLSFYNYNEQSAAPASKTLKYGESFKNYNPGEPKEPAGVEAGSLTFIGWYTTPEAYAGTEVDWNGTMPVGNVTFYAKWELVRHEVDFWLDQTAAGAGDTEKHVVSYSDITHGLRIPDVYQDEEDYISPEDYLAQRPDHPYTLYDFAGWYFIDENGDEMRFDIDTMPINRDMDIYAKWTSDDPVQFVFHYMHENGTPIADSYWGEALPGTLVTKNAKIGSELNLVPAGQDPMGYIPRVNSHSLTLNVDATLNEFTFWYVQPAKVDYTVQYLLAEKQTIDGKEVLAPVVVNGKYVHLADEKQKSTINAIVTENYVPVRGHMPQATQLRLIVSMNEAMNVLQFLYVENTEHELYNATHIVIDHNKQEREYYSEKNMQGTIGRQVTVTKQSITGYTFKEAYVEQTRYDDAAGQWVTERVPARDTADVTVKHTLTDGGMHVYLYYEPVDYPYIVYHLDAVDNTIQRAEPTSDMAPYGSTLTTEDFVKTIEDYRVSSMTPAEIKVDVEDGAVPAVNVMYIYYERDDADIVISKIVTESEDPDAPELSDEEWATAFEFTVKLTDKHGQLMAEASVTLPGEDRKTVALTNGVLSFTLKHEQTMTIHDLLVGATYAIEEAETEIFETTYSAAVSGTLNRNGVNLVVTNRYPKYSGQLTITKTGLKETKESAIVKAVVGSDVYYLVLNAANHCTATISGIRPGTEYTVTELTDWTWQYSSRITGGSGTITEVSPRHTVTIDNTFGEDQWLHDESHVTNDFGLQTRNENYNK